MTAWEGARIKSLAKERGVSLIKMAEHLGVSRQSVNDWINGHIPKGTHLISLSRELDVSPKYFFSDRISKNLSVPLHRKRGVAKVTEDMRSEAVNLAKQYEKLFKWAPQPGLIRTLRVDMTEDKNIISLAEKLRDLSGIQSNKPMDYTHTFNLLNSLNIVTVFRSFPKSIKGYAFYSKIHGHRVVFVNNDTNVLDLIFPLLHESIHAVGDDELDDYDEAREHFCDSVANYTQFPKEYVTSVYNTLKGRRKSIQINLLKDFSSTNHHSIFGIVEQLKQTDLSIDFKDVGGANTNLKKEFPTIGRILFKEKDVCDYVQNLKTLSPLFVDIVSKQIDNVTTSKVGEWLGFETGLDAKQVIKELKKISSATDI
jgi:transcriptional regulator with XRE-family HTH domain